MCTIANIGDKVKLVGWILSPFLAIHLRVTRRKPETLDDLLSDVIAEERLTAFAKEAGIRPWTLLRLRTGEGTRTHRGTILALAAALGMTEERVRSAIEATRAAAGE